MKISNANYDILKIVLSIMVVAIHTINNPAIYPWVRIAVPLFFIMSSYFFFCSIDKKELSVQCTILMSFVKRNVQLYIFWFIVLFPITVTMRQYFSNGFVIGIKTIVKFGLLNSTFIASWFIMALVLAVGVIFGASKVITDFYIVCFSLLAYFFAALYSSYLPFLGKLQIFEIYNHIMINPCFNFTGALIWVMIGKWFVHHSISKRYCVYGVLAGSILLFIEWFVLFKVTGKFKNDCYFMLIPLSTYLFGLIQSFKPVMTNSFVKYRKMTIITFASHGTIAYILDRYINVPGICKFILVVIICLTLSKLILYLENHKYFEWLKYAH